MMNNIKYTQKIKYQFVNDDKDIEGIEDFNIFKDKFKSWKELGPDGEYNSYFFGKDSAYEAPKVNGKKNKLMHVHLVPIVDEVKKAKWDKAWGHKSRKTSDRCLVYADNERGDFLLISILSEPDAHNIARMTNEKDKEVMNAFAKIAEKFIFDDEVIC